ncbi:hypothetical protein DRO59_00525 [Candidatus Bathyarchaeota archaeon]|nr:MAG: hypothetical protein DRO59_00525 [Candidatus Bathyarchaeota archaeon]
MIKYNGKMSQSQWKTIIIRLEIYKILKSMAMVEHRNISNMAQECILDYFSRKHKDLKIID